MYIFICFLGKRIVSSISKFVSVLFQNKSNENFAFFSDNLLRNIYVSDYFLKNKKICINLRSVKSIFLQQESKLKYDLLKIYATGIK